MLGIICAMETEAAPIVSLMTHRRERINCGKRFVSGGLFGGHAVLCVCGEGKVIASFAATALVKDFGVKALLNLGVAGAASPSLGLYDVVAGDSAIQYDFDLSYVGDLRRGQLPGFDDEFIPLYDGYVKGFEKLGLRCGRLATIDTFRYNKENLEFLRRNNVLAEDMEIAAIAQVAEFMGVRVASVKSISNAIAENGGDEFGASLFKAIDAYVRLLPDIVNVVRGE